MEDEGSTSLDAKDLGNLRVVDLKQELEKRGLSKSGSKKDLVKRLKQQLEFEKLCEERKSSGGDFDRKLELDAEIQQNEFVQQYLAQQRKRYAERKEEEKRLEMEALERPSEEEEEQQGEENQAAADKNQECDSNETADEKNEEPSKEEVQMEDKNDVNVQVVDAHSREEKRSSSSETEDEEPVRPSTSPVSANIRTGQTSPQPIATEQAGENQNDAMDLVDITKRKEIVKNISPPSSTESEGKVKIPKDFEMTPESIGNEHVEVSASNVPGDVKEETACITHGNISNSECEKPKLLIQDSNAVKDNNDFSPDVAQDITEQTEGSNDFASDVAHDIINQTKSNNDACDVPQDITEHTDNNDITSDIAQDITEQMKDNNETSSDVVQDITEQTKDNNSTFSDIAQGIIEETNDNKETTSDVAQSITEQTKGITDTSSDVAQDITEKTKDNNDTSLNATHDITGHTKDNDNTSSDVTHDIIEQTDRSEPQGDILDASEESKRSTSISSCPASTGGNASPENLCKQDSMASMESSECSSVPYSLSDIQLPESPGHLKCKDINEEKSSKIEPVPEVTMDQNLALDTEMQSNGVPVDDTQNSTNEEVVSESETKESINSVDSPVKNSIKKDSDCNQQIAESSEEKASKDAASKEQKSLKHAQQLDESDNDKSSDSDKYQQSRSDQIHRSRGEQRKRIRCSRSRSSSSSSTRSSDSSPKRRHSKKSLVNIKNKNFVENDESNPSFEKSSEDKPDKQKGKISLIESVSSASLKKRLKIKRDNVPLEINAANVESMESTSSRSVDNITSSTSHSVLEKPAQKEPTEVKLSFSELSYVPRKVSLSNRKLNRKSSEDKCNEPKSKRNKWESFAAAQKVSQTISISTDSLKTWFPDFKLMSEPSSSLEVEPDEHSLSAADDRNTNVVNTDATTANENGMKQDSAPQVDVEDSESQEPNFEDTSEQGPVSKIIFIQNLVRPFTLNQLKDLLKQNGKIVEEYFWIDKIKSKCFVMYETEKEAVKARNSLNNTRWPSSNPKILSVEYSNEEEMEQHKKGNEPQPKPVIEPPVVPEVPEVVETRMGHLDEDHKRKDRERRKERERSKPLPPVREWDKDKVMQDSPEREHIPKEDKPRSSDKKEKKESKKRPNEDTPAKLLDDLFQKTKNPPCIYWLPLTEEQAKQKEDAQKMRKLEREKRNQQLKEQEEAERRNKRARSSRRSREKENRKSSTRSCSPVTRRR